MIFQVSYAVLMGTKLQFFEIIDFMCWITVCFHLKSGERFGQSCKFGRFRHPLTVGFGIDDLQDHRIELQMFFEVRYTDLC